MTIPAGWTVETGPGATVTATGELDLASAPALQSAVHDLRDSSPERVTVDLRGVTFLDSFAISVLVALHLRLEDDQVPLVIRPSGAVSNVMAITGLDGVLTLEA